MSKQVLISDPILFSLSQQSLKEAVDKIKGKFIVTSVIQRANSKNENGRVYTKAVLQPEISRYEAEFVKGKRAFGELDHSEKMVVELKNTCISIMEIWWEGDEVKAIIEVLNTPAGKIVQDILKSGYTVGISSRGAGSVTQVNEDTVEVDDDYTLLCWDVVSNPSTHGAFLQPKQMNESVEIHKESSKIDEIILDILCLNTGFCECQLK